MSRSVFKFLYLNKLDFKVFKGISTKILSKKIFYNRSNNLFSYFLNLNFKIYNGKISNDLVVTKDVLGYKFGSFSNTKMQTNKIHFLKKKR